MSFVPAVGPDRRRGARALTRKQRSIFLERLAAGFSVAAAAAGTGKARQRFYEERDADPEFAEQWRQAWEAGQDVIEDELMRAATEGWQEVTEEFDGEGQLKRRVVAQRRNPALLAKLERKRQPEGAGGPLVSVNVNPAISRPVGPEDFLAVFRANQPISMLRQMHPHLVRWVMPYLTPAELEELGVEIVDGVATE